MLRLPGTADGTVSVERRTLPCLAIASKTPLPSCRPGLQLGLAIEEDVAFPRRFELRGVPRQHVLLRQPLDLASFAVAESDGDGDAACVGPSSGIHVEAQRCRGDVHEDGRESSA